MATALCRDWTARACGPRPRARSSSQHLGGLRSRHRELIERARERLAIRTPAAKAGGMAESPGLEPVVRDFAHAIGANGNPVGRDVGRPPASGAAQTTDG